ncbi:translocation/assembly module TamB domain-containing protein [Yoonia sediminilitoris]|uniref:Autotransporter secretion inner membrane protein TamB n=1 Tax=Yoonia sediminilitoris TaxID=1286148 RepID=A0A2T6KMF7_9RHOB|nr:translocation/assembly module TamB domain-containing protein [Yoonia sediminilitoris]PUB17364.1 autotransporter secretion inner membrane protein TamB [Yoonia sediminilitoris]RCW97659.1 autotransporter secretion inner membrane protein TamB [Yoonia sediminilitoris]
MKHLLCLLALLLTPFAALAQSQEEDKGYITTLIEDNLSGAGREVNIIGFKGALSSEATIDVLSIADAEGIWLTLEDITLIWSRAALLRGAVSVKELSAQRIVVSRAPISESTAPTPEATPFSLPELPVSISLGQLDIARIELGESFLGEPVSINLQGTAELSDGQGTANVIATRLGSKQGVFEIDGSYDNATRVLGLLLNIEEGADGIAARLLDLPGKPAVGLRVEGNAPISDFSATIAVATQGEDRLSGDFALKSDDQTGSLITFDVGGDVSPLFAPAYRPFFGNEARLFVSARQAPDGSVDVSDLRVQSQRLNVTGAVRVGPEGWPETIDLTGGIARSDVPLLLPLSGPETRIAGLDLAVKYDRRKSDDWTADISIDAFDRPGLFIDSLNLEGGGLLRDGTGANDGLVTAELNYGAQGLRLDDAGAAAALGDAMTGTFAANRIEDGPTDITSFTLTGAGIDVNIQGSIAGPADGFQTALRGTLAVEALSRFSTLVGREIGGSADLAVQATAAPLDGLFDVTLNASTNDLTVGIPQADAILAGRGTVAANAVRDTAGTRLEDLRVRTSAAEITGRADLTSDGSSAEFTTRLNDLQLVVPELSGPASLRGTVDRSAKGVIDFDLSGIGPRASLSAKGTVNPAENGQTVNAAVVADVSDLRAYAALIGQPLAGAAKLDVSGVLLTNGLRFDLDVRADTQDIVTGIARLDPFLAGAGTLTAEVSRPNATDITLSGLDLVTPAFSLRGDARVAGTDPQSADISLRINDAQMIDPSLRGPVIATIKANPTGSDDLKVDVAANGPGIDLNVDATIDRPSNEITGSVQAGVENLGAYQLLIGQPVAGAVSLDASGSFLPDLSRFDSDIALRTQNLQIGNPTVDTLLRGSGRVDATLDFANGRLSVESLQASTGEVTLSANLDGSENGTGRGRFYAQLRDASILTDQISGPVTVEGTAALGANGAWDIDVNGSGSGGLAARVDGQVQPGGQLNLRVTGAAPLALANKALEPQRLSGTANIDLSVNGSPGLDALGGQITIEGGRLAAPTLAQAFTDIGGQIGFSGSRALINIGANVEAGGRVTVTGPVDLEGPNTADITVTLRNVVLQDPELYTTSVDGTVRVTGPVTGGARVVGRLELGQTDVRVPSSSISTLGELPDVRHINPSGAVVQTLTRAGATVSGATPPSDADAGPQRPGFPLDIVIDAPSRIFIRGRGLDAELGGRLTIGGTSNDVRPVGRFNLLRGRIDILQQRFDLTEGSATLQGDFIPFIRLVATTQTDNGTTINIIVEGPAGQPEVRFESVPELPQDEVLSQLIFGRDIQSISPLQAVQLASAISTLAGNGGGAVDRLRQGIGLDDFDVTTAEDGTAAVRAGKYLSENVYTDVTVTSEGETEINLNLDITNEVTAKGSVDQEGETSVGIFFERDY